MILNINQGGGSSGEPELLWTNPAPSSAFYEQNVIVPDAYDAYLISVRYRTYLGEVVTSYVPKTASNFLVPTFWLSDSNLYIAVREITSISGGVISFGWGKYGGSSSITRNCDFGIPLAIWGVKWTI